MNKDAAIMATVMLVVVAAVSAFLVAVFHWLSHHQGITQYVGIAFMAAVAIALAWLALYAEFDQ